MNSDHAKAAIQWLMKTDIKGAEAHYFLTVVQSLSIDANAAPAPASPPPLPTN
jgi:hypothetical protein